MTTISTIGLDLAKSVFQVHGIDGTGQVLVRRKLRRAEVLAYFTKLAPCLVGMEACGSAHHWARALAKLGHRVRLIPPAYVKPYVKRGKTDAADAAAICEAVSRPTMTFVAVKSVEQQGLAMVHRVRAKLVSQRTQAINMLRGHLAELGLIAAKGLIGRARLAEIVRDEATPLPAMARLALAEVVAQIAETSAKIDRLDRAIQVEHKACETSRRLQTIPGVGPVIASAVRARVGDAARFENGRHLAAWLGLTPGQDESGGTARANLPITKKGDRYLRQLLVSGQMAIIRQAQRRPDKWPKVAALLARKRPKQAAVMLANRAARVIHALLVNGGVWQPGHRHPRHLAAAALGAAA